MKKYFFLLSFLALTLSCETSTKSNDTNVTKNTSADTITKQKAPFGIVIHGGAGYIKKGNLSDSLEQAYHDKLQEAITAGNEILKNGGSAVEAVQRTINVMEDSPLFNSGKGAVLTNEELPELDASIMDGKSLNAGGVAGISTVKNPINLAYEVMENSDHVLLAREGAEAFAKTRNLEIVDPEYFITDKQLQNIQRIKRENENRDSRELHGLYRALINNMVKGVTDGFSKELHMNGVGYTAELKNTFLMINAGYSHAIYLEIPLGINIELPNATTILIKGIDKQNVGDIAAKIRQIRKPEPYKGKGIKYSDEYIRRKAGKTVGATAGAG